MNFRKREYTIEITTSKSLEEITDVLFRKVDFNFKYKSSFSLEKEFYGDIESTDMFIFRRRPFFPNPGDIFARGLTAPVVYMKVQGEKIHIRLRNPSMFLQIIFTAIAIILFFAFVIVFIKAGQLTVNHIIIGFWLLVLCFASYSITYSFESFKKRIQKIASLLE